jgi:coenzyme F420-reducing hydrogenase delta subunit/NAD-dependent dihydropyrimidine dehydrogenase PreA subunit
MCSGRVDLEFVLRAFAKGADGVFIGGCRLKECNYVTHGNYHALNLALLCKKIMKHIGLNPGRLDVAFMSSGEGMLFADAVDGFVERVKDWGPLGQSEGLDKAQLAADLDEVIQLVPYIKIAKREKLTARLESRDAYDGHFSDEEIERLLRDVVAFYIDPQKCQACMICLRRCPVDAIAGGKKQVHVIDQDICIKCGSCFEACPSRFGAVKQLDQASVPPPLPESERMIPSKSKTEVSSAG